MPPRVVASAEALALTRELKKKHGALVFHQSGGCCEGTAPMCFRQSDFRVGPRDVLLGSIEGCPIYVGAEQFDYLAACQLTIDVVTGGGDSFSLEAADGERFATRSRLFTREEAAELAADGPPPTGPDALGLGRR
jgi:uncharacterized protein (DUF779 family)